MQKVVKRYLVFYFQAILREISRVFEDHQKKLHSRSEALGNCGCILSKPKVVLVLTLGEGEIVLLFICDPFENYKTRFLDFIKSIYEVTSVGTLLS